MSNVSAGKDTDDDGEKLNDVEKALDKLGIKLRNSNKEWRNFEEVLDEVAGKWSEFAETERSQIATAIAGTRQQETFRALMNNYDMVGDLAKTAADSTGSATERMGVYLDSVEAKTKQLKATWEEFVMSLGQSESYKDLLSFLEWVLQNIPTVIAYVTALMVAFKGEQIVKGIKKIKDGLFGLLPNFKAVKESMQVLQKYSNAVGNELITMAEKEKIAAAEATILNAKMRALQTGFALVVAAIGIGIQAYQSWKQANVDAANAAKEEAEKHQEKVKTIETISEKYKELYTSAKPYNEKQEELKNLSEELKKAYDNEAESLDLLNGKYEENIKAMEDKSNQERKLTLGELKAASDKGEDNLDNAINFWDDARYTVKDKKDYVDFSNEKNKKAKDDIEKILKTNSPNMLDMDGWFIDGKSKSNAQDYDQDAARSARIFGGIDSALGMALNRNATNEESLKYAQQLQEYLDKNSSEMTQEMINMVSGFIAKIHQDVDEHAEDQYKNKQDYQLAKATQNEDGSRKQEIKDYEKVLKEQQDLQEKYDKETDKAVKESLQKQLSDKYEETKNALEKVKQLYNKDDEEQSTLSEQSLLDYLGFSEGSTDKSKNNVYSYLSDEQKDEYKKIKNEAEKTNKLSDDAIKKLQEMRNTLSGEEQDNFIKAVNEDLEKFGYKAEAAKLALQQNNLQEEFNKSANNGSWKSDNDANDFKEKTKEKLSDIGISTNTSQYQEAENLLDGTQKGFEEFYNKIQEFIKDFYNKKEETEREVAKREEGSSKNVYKADERGTGSPSEFKSYLDDVKDAQTMSDKLSDGKVLDYSDLEKLRKKSDKLRQDIDDDGKVTSENLQEYIDDTLNALNTDLDEAIDTFSDAIGDIEETIGRSDIPDEMKKAFEDATDEANKELEDGKINFGDLELDATDLGEVTDAVNDMTVAKDQLNNAFSDEYKNQIDDTTLSATMMAMSFGDGAMAAEIFSSVLAGDEASLDYAWQMLTEDSRQAIEQQGNFNWMNLDASQKQEVLNNLAGNWSELDAQTRNALASMAAYFGTYEGASQEVKDKFTQDVGGTLQKIKSTVAYGTNEARFRKGANTSAPKSSGGSKGGSGSKNNYSADDAASDLKDILQDIEKYEEEIELDLEDQTEEFINQEMLSANRLDRLKEELDYYDDIYDVTERTTKWLETQNKILENQSKKVGALQNATASIEAQRQKLINQNSGYNVASWFDSEGNETLAYGDLINSFEYRKEAIQREIASRMRNEYNSVSGSTSKDAISAAKDRIKQIEEEGDIRIKELEKERDKVENIHDSVEELNDAWKDNQEAIRDALAELHERVISIRDELLDDITEQLEKAVDKMNTSIEKDVTRIEQLVTIQETYNDLLNETIETQQELDSELQASLDSFEYLDEQMRQLMFNEDDYKVLSETLSGIQEDIAGIWEDHYKQIDELTDDTMYKAEYITNETERQLDMKMKEYELAKAELDVAKARTNLQNVQNERNVRMYVGGQWIWTADPNAVKDAQQQLADAEREKTKIEREAEQKRLLDKMNQIIDSDNLQIDENNELLERIQEAIELQTQEVKSIEDALNNASGEDLPALNDVLQGAFGRDGGDFKTIMANLNKRQTELAAALQGHTTDSANKLLQSGTLSKSQFMDMIGKLGYGWNENGTVTTQDGSFKAHYQGWVDTTKINTPLGTGSNGASVTGGGAGSSGGNSGGGGGGGNGFPRSGSVKTNSLPLNIRSGAGTNYRVLGTMPRGASLTVTGESGGWAQIEYRGIKGWASKQYLAYDQGGLAKGKGVLLKDVNTPERVLSPQQTKSFDKLVDNLTVNPILSSLTKNNIKGTSNFNRQNEKIGETKQYYFSNFTVEADNISEFISSLEGMIPISNK